RILLPYTTLFRSGGRGPLLRGLSEGLQLPVREAVFEGHLGGGDRRSRSGGGGRVAAPQAQRRAAPRKRGLGVDVLTAARTRISRVFDDAPRVTVSFSGGKDSGVVLE